MAPVFHALLSLLLVVLPLLPHHVDANAWESIRDKLTGAGAHDEGNLQAVGRPRFFAGPWKHAYATFNEAVPGTFGLGGGCGYEDVVIKEGYGLDTAAVSSALFNNGQACGACFEIRCVDNPSWCKPGQKSLIVTATNHCPPNNLKSPENGGWCNLPREHFDISMPSFSKIAEYNVGVVPIIYRRIPCNKQGGIKFTISGNPYFNQVLVWNVAGAGDVTSVDVKGHKNLRWTPMKRLWGQKWVTDQKMVGEKLSFRVRTSDGRSSTSWHIVPDTWQYGQTFQGKNFI